MIRKLNKNAPLIYLALLLIFFGCSVEEDITNNPQSYNVDSKNQVRRITGGEIIAIKKKLEKEIERTSEITIVKENRTSFRTLSTGEIEFSEILEVIDSLGIKNYTFRIINHPNDDLKTFHNLVLTENNDTLEITVMKYEMSNQFFQEYYAGTEEINAFQGKISALSLSPANPCEDITVNYPSDGPGDGSGGGPGDGPGDGPGSGSGGSGDSCVSINFSFECSCGNSFNTWAGAYGCASSGSGNYTITIVVRYLTLSQCRTAEDPCNPDGGIGILDPLNNILRCVTKEKLLEIFPNASLDNRTKLANNIRIYGGYFGINTKEEVCHFLGQVGAETDGLTTLNATEDLDYATANAAVKSWGSKFTITNEPGKIHPAPYLHNPQGLANFVYATKNRNQGGTDGWDYRGRGVLQLTGRGNYEDYHAYLTSIGLGYFYNSPDDVSHPYGLQSVLSGMWFFKNRVLNKMEITTATTVDKVTNKVNRYTDKDSRQKRRNYYNTATLKLNC